MEELQPQQPKKKLSNLALRSITASAYIAVLLLFFVLKLLVSDLFFDAIILAFALIGAWEMTRAFKDKMHASQKTVVLIFSALIIIAYAASDFYFADILGVHLPAPGGSQVAIGRNYAMHIVFVVFMVGISILLGLLVFAHQNVTLESTGYSLLSYIYPSFLLVVLSVCNHLELYSELAIMFVFVVAPFADVFAFFFGKIFGKALPMKMAPNISPNKTLIGAFGGLIGGAIGANVIFYLCYGLNELDKITELINLGWSLNVDALNLLFFMGLGIVTAAFSQFGDLVESGIKRKLGVKDMGKILPGHGGVLDRIDSSLYAGLIVCAVLVLRIMIVG
ncbi:MAG: phosphatidate cytidylyltransferase [Clostridia bacterium]|nr:phosphatidate cytidylyltransferase [Clostridia bacterium]